MQPTLKILFGGFLAICWSSLATANPPDPTQSLDPAVLRAITNMQLDSAFERFVSQGSDRAIYHLSGPSSMTCESAGMLDGIETCVVTTMAQSKSRPAALAQY
jgi:hypothetical protein